MNRYTKRQVVEVVRQQLPIEDPLRNSSVDELCSLWFVTKRSDTGFQLNLYGHSAFISAEIDYHDIVWDLSNRKSVLSTMRELNLKIFCPFYIIPTKSPDIKYHHAIIRLYDERLAQWIELRGSMNEYLASINIDLLK